MATGTSATYRPAAAPRPCPKKRCALPASARLVLVINLGSFVERGRRRCVSASARLGDVRRGAAGAAAQPHRLAATTRPIAIEQDAYTLRIFRSRLLYNHFFPTYRLAWDSTMRERMQLLGCADIDALAALDRRGSA